MRDVQKKVGAALGVVAYLVATAAGFACGVPAGVVLFRAALAAIGGYVVGRLLGHVAFQALLDDMADARSRQVEAKEEPQG